MKFGSPISGGSPFRDPRAGGIGAECPGSQCSLWLASILQVALPPHHEGVSEMTGWGGVILQSGLLGNFTPLFLFNGCKGRDVGIGEWSHFTPSPPPNLVWVRHPRGQGDKEGIWKGQSALCNW